MKSPNTDERYLWNACPHLPKGSASWSLGHLKRLSMAIIWFESAIEVIVPKQRRQNIWAKANHKDHPQFKAQTVENILHMINSCETIDILIERMNPQGDRYFGWNFTNLRENGIGAVEFRRTLIFVQCIDLVIVTAVRPFQHISR